MTSPELFNLIQSTNPCPKCVTASNLNSMTKAQWIANRAVGVPGSNKRYCKKKCHCLLIPEGTELPALGDDLLRGDKGTDIPKITDTFPLELRFEELSAQWRAKFGDMPGRFARMPLNLLIKALEKDLGIG